MLYVASDHAGFAMKEKFKNFLQKKGVAFEDLGAYSEDSTDYTEYAFALGQKVAQKPAENKGILVCGTGVGMCIAANKVKRVRAALIYDEASAKAAAEHNNANVACFGARTMDAKKAEIWMWLWLTTAFSDADRHRRRVDYISRYEEKS